MKLYINLKKIMSIVMLSLMLGGAVATTVVNANEVIQTVEIESQVEDNAINTKDEDKVNISLYFLYVLLKNVI